MAGMTCLPRSLSGTLFTLGSGATVENEIMGRIPEPPKHGEGGCALEMLNIFGTFLYWTQIWGNPHSDWLAVEHVTSVLPSQLPINLILKISLITVTHSWLSSSHNLAGLHLLRGNPSSGVGGKQGFPASFPERTHSLQLNLHEAGMVDVVSGPM